MARPASKRRRPRKLSAATDGASGEGADTVGAVVDPIALLTRVDAALTARDYRAALDGVIAVWRSVPDPALVPVAEAIGALAARDAHLPIAADDDSRDAQWHAAAASGDPVVRHHLIATVREGYTSTHLARLRALAGTRDPRLSPVVRRMILAHHPADGLRDYWAPLFAVLPELGDPAVVDMIDAIDPIYVSTATRERLDKARARLAAALPDRPRLSNDASDVLAAIASAADAARQSLRDRATEAKLLAAIYADPASDGPRAIYADWLQELGDPRGEYIALSLAMARRDRGDADSLSSDAYDAAAGRTQALVAEHQRAWLGELAQAVALDDWDRRVHWGRGFPYAAHVTAPIASAAWATMETLHGGFPGVPAHPMPSLRAALRLDRADFERLAEMPAMPMLERVSFACGDKLDDAAYRERVDGAARALARALPRLPALRQLTVIEGRARRRLPSTDPWPWREPPLRDVQMPVHLDDLGPWLVAALDSGLERFVAQNGDWSGWTVQLVRDGRGAFSTLEVRCSASHVSNELVATFPQVIGALDQLPADSLSTIKFFIDKEAWNLPRRRLFAAFLGRQTKVVTLHAGAYRPPKR